VNDRLMFVQFPHPGAEHRPTGESMDWNRRDHARKFLRASGEYLLDGRVRAGPLTFWGEWEPQSRIIARLTDARPGLPHWVHEPTWERPRHRTGLKNTDPLVFGDRFLYSNCRQQRNRKLRGLGPGSLVLFGSKLHGEFVLDTVFVVDDESTRYMLSQADEIPAPDWTRAVLLEPLKAASDGHAAPFRMYQGRRRRTNHDPFSFVPCMPWRDDGAPFARPAIRLGRRWIEPNLAQGAKATPATTDEIRHLWREIVDQVAERAGLGLGFNLEPPAQVSSATR
jgi:hypothetical protein